MSPRQAFAAGVLVGGFAMLAVPVAVGFIREWVDGRASWAIA